MSGIILRTGLKGVLNTLTRGEIGNISNTNELVIEENGLKYRPIENQAYPTILKETSIPSNGVGAIGDFALDIVVGEHKEYYNKNNWMTRYEGYSEAYLLENFEPKVEIPPIVSDEFIKIDGTTPFNVGADFSTPDSIITKGFIDSLIPVDAIGILGNDEMVIDYTPYSGQSVVDLKYIGSGNYVIIPPTTMPTTPGIIWNNNGIPTLSVT